MPITAQQLFTQAIPSSRWQRIIRFPLARIPVALVYLLPAIAFHSLAVILVVDKLAEPAGSIAASAVYLLDIILMAWSYRFYVRRIERREPLEFSKGGALAEGGTGWLLSLAMIGSIVVLLTVLGHYRVSETDSMWMLAYALIQFSSGAFLQELLFRIILFRLCEEWMGTALACAFVAILFGVAHGANENFSPLGFAVLVVTDLLLLGAFVLTRRVWLVWGIHAGWNFIQDGVFGLPNSGVASLPSWITPEVTGPRWLTGGAFGLEASAPGVVLPLAATVIVFWLALRRKQVIPPQRRRPRSHIQTFAAAR